MKHPIALAVAIVVAGAITAFAAVIAYNIARLPERTINNLGDNHAR